MISSEQFEHWLKELGNAWKSKDPQKAAKLFSKNIIYYEDPFEEPIKDWNSVFTLWKEIEKQEGIEFTYKVIVVNDTIGVSQWTVSFFRSETKEKVNLNGVFIVQFDENGLVNEFHQWWNTK